MDIMSYTGNLFAFLRWRHPRYLLSISYLQIKFSEQFSANANLLNPKAGLFLEYDVWEAVTLAQIFIKKKLSHQSLIIKEAKKWFLSTLTASANISSPRFACTPVVHLARSQSFWQSSQGQQPFLANMVAALDLGWCRWQPDFLQRSGAIFASWCT